MSRDQMVIPTPEDVSPAWLTERLRAAGYGVTVDGFEATDIGTGQLGRCIRYTLETTGRREGAPSSLVGKFPSDDPDSRQTGVGLRNYFREVQFYRELQPSLTISTPHCYFAAIEGEGPRFVLLLEDLAPAQPGNQIEGCDEEVAEAAVLELVGLHAPSWNDSALLGLDWLGAANEESAARTTGLYQECLPGFLDRYGHRLEPDSRDILRRYGDALFEANRALPDPFSLIHIDYRLDNLLIDPRTSPPRIVAVDWQSITVGLPLVDVAYFLGGGLAPEVRRQCEERIVRRYHERLLAAGIAGFSWADCSTAYRRGAFSGFGVTVVASMLVQETERGNEMFVAMAQRHTRQALDLDSLDVL